MVVKTYLYLKSSDIHKFMQTQPFLKTLSIQIVPISFEAFEDYTFTLELLLMDYFYKQKHTKI